MSGNQFYDDKQFPTKYCQNIALVDNGDGDGDGDESINAEILNDLGLQSTV